MGNKSEATLIFREKGCVAAEEKEKYDNVFPVNYLDGRHQHAVGPGHTYSRNWEWQRRQSSILLPTKSNIP